ncbi:MAG: hypothetical protein M3467_04760 [Actinomycetota bacterium]|nr:hypothetical protein [Actinomycetota bacterium]
MSDRHIDLEVGLGSAGSTGWSRILQQEGLRHRGEDVQSAPVVVLEDELPDWTEGYVSAGGVAVVSGAPSGAGLLPDSIEGVIGGFERPDAPRLCTAPTLARLFSGQGKGVCRLHERRVRKNGMDPGRFPLILRRRVGRGWLLFTGVPLTRLLMAHGDTLRRFSPHSDVTERVSSIDKAEVADTLVWLLRTAFAAAGLPYVRPVRFPHGAASVLIFRIDVDGAYGDRCAALAKVASAHGVPLSIFVNRQLCEEHPGTLPPHGDGGTDGGTVRHEIGQHGSTHNLFDTVADNLANLRAGAAWVEERTGVVARSFVAPRGMWNPALGQALAEMGYRYSSDFGLDFDSLPFRVPGSGILQIPVHPYSPERAVEHAREHGSPPVTPAAVAAHYLAVVQQQVAANRPTHVYGHPEVLGAMADQVLPTVFADVRRRGLRTMTLAQMTDWWELREGAGMRARVQAGTGTLLVDYDAERLPVEVDGADGLDVMVAGARRRVPVGERSVLLPADGGISAAARPPS